ncbi:hypothetical protein BDA99DRAFT_601319 [Phascolomyces articulosus]|uniref:Heat shock 70 kDa protein 12A n=1 Tax=Phascolomyces articulosus TaxID=60185 RepID=A0AAD5PJ56_9FUNG|nr:hypothetical protein BDA99DRAFT_601319 [Phascolomyces articulosus]
MDHASITSDYGAFKFWLCPYLMVVIAYDFGTTYSGAAYAFTHTTPTEVFDVQNWPQKGGNFYPKVPTLSVYPRRNQQQKSTVYKQPTLLEWGYTAKKIMLKPRADKENVLLSQFKLHLDESLHRSPLENELTPLQAVADYLAALHKHTLEEVSRGFAQNYQPDTFRYCLTVPAVWSDKAKSLMRQAAVQAGLIKPLDPPDRLILVSEPEAAALYCEETMADQVNFKDKDRIMVCDAGGGTVDLIVFQVDFTRDAKKRELKEVTKGMGESCGSVFLDARYRELLKSKLGTHVMNKVNPREMNTMMEYFIGTIKSEFNGVDDFFLELPRSIRVEDLPASVRKQDQEDGYLDEGILKLSNLELKKKVFDPVVDKVISLIEQQYRKIHDKRLEYLFLVGGFGSSKYLYQSIHKVFQDTKVKHIVCPAERAALAVVRGAAYYGINPRVVVSRISRRTYGTNVNRPFDEELDPPSKRVVKPDGVKCRNRFSVYVTKNEELPVDHCIKQEFSVAYEKGKSVTIHLYATENDTVPRYCDDPGVYRIATMSITIPEMPGIKNDERVYMNDRMHFGTTEILLESGFKSGQKCNLTCNFE